MKHKFDIFDYLVVIAILGISVLIGVYHGFRMKIRKTLKTVRSFGGGGSDQPPQTAASLERALLKEQKHAHRKKNKVSEYLVASSSMGAVPIGFSLLASFYSATLLLGLPVEIYQYGIQYWMCVFGMMCTPVLAALIFGPMFAKLKIMTVFEYLEIRFESKLVKQVGMICNVVKNFMATSIFMYGPATSLALLTDLDERYAIALIGIVGTFYTTIGGIRAVIWTDLFQACVMIATLLLILIKGIYDVDGIGNLIRINAQGGRFNFIDLNPDPFRRQSLWSNFFGIMVYFSMPYCFDQQMIQRFKAARTKRTAQLALLLNVPGIFLIVSLCALIGLVLYANFAECDPLSNPSGRLNNPNQLVGHFVQHNLNMIPGVAGLFLGALFCGSLSSVSSTLNSQAAILWNDFLKHFGLFRSFNDRRSLYANQVIVLLCGVLSTGLSFVIANVGGNLTQISSSLNGCFTAPIIGLFLLGLFFADTNKVGAIVGTVFGFASGCWLAFGTYIVSPKYPMLDVSVAGCNASSPFASFNSTIRPTYFIDEVTGFRKFYYLSYMLFTCFGVLVTVITGVFFSVITGCNRKKRVDRNLLIIDLLGFLKVCKNKDEEKSGDYGDELEEK